MPTTDVPVTQITRAGVDVGADASEVAGDTVNGHSVDYSPTMYLVVRNSGATERNIAVDLPNTIDGQVVPDKPIVIPASATGKICGPWPETLYKQRTGDDTNKIVFTVDHAELELLAFKV